MGGEVEEAGGLEGGEDGVCGLEFVGGRAGDEGGVGD